MPFDLIQVHRYSPAAAGAALLPFVLLISAMSRWTGGLAARIGARPILVLGPVVAASGFLLLALPGTGGAYWSTFFPGITVLGLGMGLTVAPLTASVMGSVDRQHAGVASGINNAVSRAAGLLAVAALGVILLSRFNQTLDAGLERAMLPPNVADVVALERGRLAAAELPAWIDDSVRSHVRRLFDEAYVAGFRALMWTSGGLALLASLAGLWIKEDRRPLLKDPSGGGA